MWAKHYGKEYTSSDHRAARKAIYAHARLVIDHNQVGTTSSAFLRLARFVGQRSALTTS